MGPNAAAEVSARPVPMEPMYILINLGLSENFGAIDYEGLEVSLQCLSRRVRRLRTDVSSPSSSRTSGLFIFTSNTYESTNRPTQRTLDAILIPSLPFVRSLRLVVRASTLTLPLGLLFDLAGEVHRAIHPRMFVPLFLLLLVFPELIRPPLPCFFQRYRPEHHDRSFSSLSHPPSAKETCR